MKLEVFNNNCSCSGVWLPENLSSAGCALTLTWRIVLFGAWCSFIITHTRLKFSQLFQSGERPDKLEIDPFGCLEEASVRGLNCIPSTVAYQLFFQENKTSEKPQVYA